MIHLTRRQSIAVASSLIAVFFMLMWALSRRSTAVTTRPGEPEKTVTPTQYPTPQQGAQFLLNEFHRSEIKNGHKIWEVKAHKGEYFPDKQRAEIFEADVWLFRPNGEQVFLKAPEALLTFDGTAMSKVHFPASVHVVYNDKLTVDTSVATYDKLTETISSDHPVNISSDLLEVAGNKFSANVSQSSIVISGGVTTVIKPQEKR